MPVAHDEATAALKRLARDKGYRDAFLDSTLLSATLWPAASRYIVAKNRPDLLDRLPLLAGLGYRLGVEVVGEEARDKEEIEQVLLEYEALIEESAKALAEPVQLGFDLSNVGLLVSAELAYENTSRLLNSAAAKGMDIILSMENSTFVDGILAVFTALAEKHRNIGITLQAQLHRTADDIETVAATGAKIRLVKGVYRESPTVALPRGPELNQRYVTSLERLLGFGGRVTCASQDPRIHELATERGLIDQVEEVEMLHGVRPDLLRGLRDRGVPCRIATVYGDNWWLHFLHRLAEHPPNVLTALADVHDPARIVFGAEYR